MPVFEFPQSRCLAAVGRCDITPQVGTYHRMWGAATHERSTGIHRPLSATVLFLRSHADPTSQHAVIAIDHCLLWTAEMNLLLATISEHSGTPQAQLTVFFSHTHGAGLMGMERKDLPGGDLIPPYLRDMAMKIAGLIRDAVSRLAPATIVYGRGKSDLATNRDLYDSVAGRYVCGFNPGGVTDDTVIVARVTRDDGPAIATLVNYACHPTTLAWENTLISPDYIGAMREVVETATEAPCLFIQGASGDIGPAEGFVGDPAVADRNGRRLGYAALAAIESLSPPGQSFEYAGAVVSGATLGPWKYRPDSPARLSRRELWQSQTIIVPLKYRSDIPNRQDLERELGEARAAENLAVQTGDATAIRDAHAMVERATRRMTRVAALPQGPKYPYPLVAWKIGDAIWMAFDGEHYNVLQRTLRERFPNVALVIGTIANGSNVWYLPDADSYGKGLYQEEVAILEKGCLEQVIEASIRMVERLLSHSQ
jgi:hypothetical protein